MKQILFLLFIAAAITANAQKTDLVTVNTVKPLKGQKMAFETSWKTHVAKFHKADHKISVYEVLSGPYIGSYHLVEANRSYADFDKSRTDAAAHSLDLDKTFFPLLDETNNATYRFMDTLSLRPDTTSESFVITVNHLKQGLDAAEYRTELRRSVKVQEMLNTPFAKNLSVSFFEQLWDGSDQTTVSIRNLKDGFKSLEANYFGTAPAGASNFRETYEKTYGGAAWDARVKLLEGAVIKTEVSIVKLRKDLSSQ